MTRKRIDTASEAHADVGMVTPVDWLEGQVVLPFSQLSPDEFELLVYLLLARENQGDKVHYYGKVGDLGRDIVHVSARGPVLAQCKRYEGSVGLDAVRQELAKLCTNLHLGAITETPIIVAVYVSSDFTAPALDLLGSRTAWTKAAPKALEAHLEKPPSAELLAHAASWWPEFELVNGAALTQRLRKHQDLLDQFFRVRKVVDAAPVEALAREVRAERAEIRASHTELLAAIKNLSDPIAQIRDIVRRAEQDNPGIEVRAEIDAKGPLWHVRAKPGAGPVEAGQLRFPKTEAGARGRAKLEHMLDTGEPITLAPDECGWNPVVQIRMDGGSDGLPTGTELRLEPHQPDEHVIVDLRSGAALLRNVEVKVERAGRKEAVLVFSYGDAFTLRMVGRAGDRASGSAEFSFASLPVDRAQQLVEFLLATTDHPIRLTDPESEELMLEIVGVSADWQPEHLRAVRELAVALVQINRELGTRYLYPSSIETADLNNARVLAGAITKRGPIAILGPKMKLQGVGKEQAQDFVEQVRSADGFTLQSNLESFALFGSPLDVGAVTLIVPAIQPSTPLEELAAQIDGMTESEFIDIDLQSSKAIYSFARWNSKT